MTDQKMDTKNYIKRLLNERLNSYEIPDAVMDGLQTEILAFMQRPERKIRGATVMTPEASFASDHARKNKLPDNPNSLPQKF